MQMLLIATDVRSGRRREGLEGCIKERSINSVKMLKLRIFGCGRFIQADRENLAMKSKDSYLQVLQMPRDEKLLSFR